MGFLERIRNWLRLTAIGKLHEDDQPLEPLLPIGPDYVVLPEDLFDNFQNELVIAET